MTEHKFEFGLWSATENMESAVRYCICKRCMKEPKSKKRKQILPMSQSILEEIKRQFLAKKKVMEWLSQDSMDMITIMETCDVINKYLNYIDPTDSNTLNGIKNKIISIGIDNNLDEKSIQCLSMYLQRRIDRKESNEQLEIAFDEFMQTFNEEITALFQQTPTSVEQPIPRVA